MFLNSNFIALTDAVDSSVMNLRYFDKTILANIISISTHIHRQG